MPQVFLSKWPTRTPAKQLRQCLPTVRRVDHTGPTVSQRGRGLMGASLPEPGADVGRSRSGHVDRDVGPQVISSVAPCASVGSATVAGVASAMTASSGLNVRAPGAAVGCRRRRGGRVADAQSGVIQGDDVDPVQ